MSTDDTSFEEDRNMALEECEAALAAVQQENTELQDKYLRAAAAIENARKQAERNAEQRANELLRNFSARLLEVVDNLERALGHAQEGNALRPGVEATLRQLQTILRNQGVTPIEVQAGETFDPQYHEAISTQEADVDHAIVAEVLQNGYIFDGQVLRPARVVVAVPARTETET